MSKKGTVPTDFAKRVPIQIGTVNMLSVTLAFEQGVMLLGLAMVMILPVFFKVPLWRQKLCTVH